MNAAGAADYRSVIGYFARAIMKDLRLVSGYDVLYGKVKSFQGILEGFVDYQSPS